MPVSSMLMSSMMSGGGGQGQGGANILAGLIGAGAGFFQRRAAKKALRNLHRPEYAIPNEIMQNQKMAQLQAQEGLPSQQYNNAMKNIQRAQTNALSGAMDRRSALMALPRLQQQATDAYSNLDAQDAAARRANQGQLYNQNANLAQYRDKAFNINQMQPYQQQYDYNMGLLGAGNQNLIGGLEKMAGGSGMLLAGGGGKSKNGNRSAQSYVPDGIYMDGEPGYSSNV